MTAAPPATADARLAAFCSDADAADIFRDVVHGNQVWRPDPFDVDTLHADARRAFFRLVDRTRSPHVESGRMLLLLGEGGSGKTHLMRAVRSRVHDHRLGFCGYLQMTTQTDNYDRYVLVNLVNSLENPYSGGTGPSGLSLLARALLDRIDAPAADVQRFRDDALEPAEQAAQVERFVDLAVRTPALRPLEQDFDLLRALLWLSPQDSRVRARVIKWLRCEELTPADRTVLGGLGSRPPADARETVRGLARAVQCVSGAALVLLADQIEDHIEIGTEAGEKWEPFRRAVGSLVNVADGAENAVVVVACLEDLYALGKVHLPTPKVARLEQQPPIRLSNTRTPDDVRAIVSVRLGSLFDRAAVSHELGSVEPYPPGSLDPLASLPTRTMLQKLRTHQRACALAGRWLDPDWADAAAPPPPAATAWDARWNEALTAARDTVADEDEARAALLAWAVADVSREMAGAHCSTTADGRFAETELHNADGTLARLLVAVCDKSPRGGGLKRQIDEAVKRAGDVPVAFVRSSEFPTTVNETTKALAAAVAPKGPGRKVQVAESDWQTLFAFRRFAAEHANDPTFAAWRSAGQPLRQVPALDKLLQFDRLLAAKPVVALPDPPPRQEVPPLPPEPAADSLPLGDGRGVRAVPINLHLHELTQHLGALGGSGSGKTTALLRVVEQLLLRGVPAILVDRKGDLARYADPEAWAVMDERSAQRSALRSAIDVQLFTPGRAGGRTLVLPAVPPDLASLPPDERDEQTDYAADALWGLLGYKLEVRNDPRRVILGRAIALAATLGKPATLDDVQSLIADRDDDLTTGLDSYEDKFYAKLAQELTTAKHTFKRLFAAGEPLDVPTLLGRGPGAVPGRTRLTVVNTQFLGTEAEAWIAQFLATLGRWAARSPSPHLQAVVLFDEADQYLPANRKPPTKPPMMNLLKRGRSAGLGVFLASQSPGDFDYICRDQVKNWLIGLVKEPTAQAKLRPMLEQNPSAAGKLASLATGQFYLTQPGRAVAVDVYEALIRTRQVPEERVAALARGR